MKTWFDLFTKRKIIYLFNSASRSKYGNNVVRTLSHPTGWINTYRYDFKGNDANIDPDEIDVFKKAPRNSIIFIIFVDRYAENGYKYYPLRTGKLLKCNFEGDRIFFEVKLDEFIYAQNIENFNSILSRTLKNLPKLTDNDPDCENDGYYARCASNILKGNKNFIQGEEAWVGSVDVLTSVEKFDPHNSEVVFIKSDLIDESNSDKSLKPIIKRNNVFYKINKGRNYNFKIYYRYPYQTIANDSEVKVKIVNGKNLKLKCDDEFLINSHSDRENIRFTTKRYLEDLHESIKLTFTRIGDRNTNFIFPQQILFLAIKESINFWIQLILALAIFSVTSIIIGTDFSSIGEFTIQNVLDKISLFKVISGFLQALTLFWLFKLIGKKLF